DIICNTGAVQLGIAAQRGQRRAQLMRSIPHETPHLFFFTLSMLDRSLQFRQHDIQRASELADLRVLGPFWNTLIQMTCSDFRGGLFYHAQRAQCASYKPESGDG